MAAKVTNELIYETLKAMQATIAQLRHDVRESIATAAEDRAHIRALMQTTGRHEDRLTLQQAQLDRIIRRMDLAEE